MSPVKKKTPRVAKRASAKKTHTKRPKPPALARTLQDYDEKRKFNLTPEPPGKLGKVRRPAKDKLKLLFVVQKHSASHLHFDFRLEHEGVLKSWAIPQGPTLDPKVRRLAVEVEDHPVAYRDFEGIIPVGQYGGGSVMVWDHGEYEVIGDFAAGHTTGKLDLMLHGSKLRGSFALVRTKQRKQWLFIKHSDEHVQRGSVHSPNDRSALTQRTMHEIAEEQSSVWQSRNRHPKMRSHDRIDGFSPMLLTPVDQLPVGSEWQYEPKLDGYRVVAFVTQKGSTLLSRNGVDLTLTYPSLARALTEFGAGRTLVIDGELVMTHDGVSLGFEAIQRNQGTPTLFAFDLLLAEGHGLLQLPLHERHQRLNTLFAGIQHPQLRLVGVLKGSAEEVLQQATQLGWEGVVAKRKASTYAPGVRGMNWVKHKLAQRLDVFVVGVVVKRGEKAFRALAVALPDPQRGLVFAGHVGGGLDEGVRTILTQKLLSVKRDKPAIEVGDIRPDTVWVEPCVRVSVRFREISSEGHLRHPILVDLVS